MGVEAWARPACTSALQQGPGRWRLGGADAVSGWPPHAQGPPSCAALHPTHAPRPAAAHTAHRRCPLHCPAPPLACHTAVTESYQLSFDTYQRQYSEDAGGAMLDRDAIAAVPGVKVRRGAGRGSSGCRRRMGQRWSARRGRRSAGWGRQTPTTCMLERFLAVIFILLARSWRTRLR